jgi:hypothetical protein
VEQVPVGRAGVQDWCAPLNGVACILHAAAKLTRGGRQRRLHIAASWPWAADLMTAWDHISALPQAP